VSLLYVLPLGLALSVAVFAWAVARAPAGYEDDRGWHRSPPEKHSGSTVEPRFLPGDRLPD
jgi:hypothetical protein